MARPPCTFPPNGDVAPSNFCDDPAISPERKDLLPTVLNDRRDRDDELLVRAAAAGRAAMILVATRGSMVDDDDDDDALTRKVSILAAVGVVMTDEMIRQTSLCRV